jgi:hypothetical protein
MLPAGTNCPTAASSNPSSIRSKPCMGEIIPETRLAGQTRPAGGLAFQQASRGAP